MRRRALRASFVVTFALGAAVASGCGGKDSIGPSPDGGHDDGSIADGSSADCPAQQPAVGAPCDLPSSAMCGYGSCFGSSNTWAVCQGGTWSVAFGSCNPPAPVYDAGPDVYDGGPDGEGPDGGHD